MVCVCIVKSTQEGLKVRGLEEEGYSRLREAMKCKGTELRRIRGWCEELARSGQDHPTFSFSARPSKQPRMERNFLEVHTRPRLAYPLRCRG